MWNFTKSLKCLCLNGRGAIAIVSGNKYDDPSSNPEQGYLQ